MPETTPPATGEPPPVFLWRVRRARFPQVVITLLPSGPPSQAVMRRYLMWPTGRRLLPLARPETGVPSWSTRHPYRVPCHGTIAHASARRKFTRLSERVTKTHASFRVQSGVGRELSVHSRQYARLTTVSSVAAASEAGAGSARCSTRMWAKVHCLRPSSVSGAVDTKTRPRDEGGGLSAPGTLPRWKTERGRGSDVGIRGRRPADERPRRAGGVRVGEEPCVPNRPRHPRRTPRSRCSTADARVADEGGECLTDDDVLDTPRMAESIPRTGAAGCHEQYECCERPRATRAANPVKTAYRGRRLVEGTESHAYERSLYSR